MSQVEQQLLRLEPSLSRRLANRWLAVDPRGGAGIASLSLGAVIVDCDEELDELCTRVTRANRSSLTIVFYTA